MGMGMIGRALLGIGLLVTAAGGAQAQTRIGTIDLAQATAPRSLGRADAPVVIEEYGSFTCSHCAHFEEEYLPRLKADFIDKGLVRLEFHDMPTDRLALMAEMAARCLPSERYNAAKDILFKAQRSWTTAPDPVGALKQLLRLGGMTDDLFQTCLASKPLLDHIAHGVQVAETEQHIKGTPTFIIRKGRTVVTQSDQVLNDGYPALAALLTKAATP